MQRLSSLLLLGTILIPEYAFGSIVWSQIGGHLQSHRPPIVQEHRDDLDERDTEPPDEVDNKTPTDDDLDEPDDALTE